MSQINLTKQAVANIPSSGKIAIYTTTGGNIATRDSLGNVHEYSPTPLESEGMIYGVRWDSVNDIMTPGIVVNGSFIATDYQNYPIQEKMIRGLLTETGVWTPVNPYDSSRLVDGSTATIDGSAGQVMTRIPRHYALNLIDGNYKYWLVSEQPFGFNGIQAWIPPAFGNGAFLYLGAFQGVALTDSVSANVGSCVLDTSGYTTNSYPNPFTNRNIVQFRAQCAHGVFSQINYCQYEVLYRLALTEFKTWKIQEQLEGNTEYSSWGYAKTTPAGATLGLGNYSGSIWNEIEGKYIANSYRGIENPFGNVWQFLDGANIDTNNNQRLWVCYNPDDYASDTTTNYIDTGCASGIDNTDGYIKDVFGTGKYASLFPVSNTGASSSTFISDYLYTASLGSGWQVLIAGGTLYYGRIAGFGHRLAYHSSSLSASSVGVRLAAAYV